jgi:hypothetical protein
MPFSILVPFWVIVGLLENSGGLVLINFFAPYATPYKYLQVSIHLKVKYLPTELSRGRIYRDLKQEIN